MKKINILYDVATKYSSLLKHIAKPLNVVVHLRNIPEELFNDLKTIDGQNYDIIIIHLGGDPPNDDSFRLADKCRHFFKDKKTFELRKKCRNLREDSERLGELGYIPIVAESTCYPIGKEEVLKYFDYYTDLLTLNNNLEELLKEYKFI